MHYLVASFAIIFLEEKESWMLYFNCLSMSFDNQCSVSLPRGAVGWSTMCVIVEFPSHTTYVSCDFAQFDF